MRRPLLALVVLTLGACGDHATSPPADDSGPDAATMYVHDPGLEGAPFTLDDPTCTALTDRVFCNDVVFSVVGDAQLHLDLYAPLTARTGRVPAIMYVHGGGWLSGSWNQVGLDIDKYIAAGYVVLSIEYRLTANPFPNPSGIVFPDNLVDVKTAVRWLREKASFVAADKILAYGFSAGAHLVSVLGTTANMPDMEGRGDPAFSSTPTAVVGLSTPLDFHLFFPANPALDPNCPPQPPPNPGGTPADGVSLLLGVAPADFETLANSPKLDQVSAMTYASGSSAPMLMFAGTCDATVPYHGLEEMAARAQAIGAPFDTFITPMAQHGGTLGTPEAKAKLDAFVHAHLD